MPSRKHLETKCYPPMIRRVPPGAAANKIIRIIGPGKPLATVMPPSASPTMPAQLNVPQSAPICPPVSCPPQPLFLPQQHFSPPQLLRMPQQFNPFRPLGPPQQCYPPQPLGAPQQFNPFQSLGPPQQFNPPQQFGYPQQILSPPPLLGPPQQLSPQILPSPSNPMGYQNIPQPQAQDSSRSRFPLTLRRPSLPQQPRMMIPPGGPYRNPFLRPRFPMMGFSQHCPKAPNYNNCNFYTTDPNNTGGLEVYDECSETSIQDSESPTRQDSRRHSKGFENRHSSHQENRSRMQTGDTFKSRTTRATRNPDTGIGSTFPRYSRNNHNHSQSQCKPRSRTPFSCAKKCTPGRDLNSAPPNTRGQDIEDKCRNQTIYIETRPKPPTPPLKTQVQPQPQQIMPAVHPLNPCCNRCMGIDRCMGRNDKPQTRDGGKKLKNIEKLIDRQLRKRLKNLSVSIPIPECPCDRRSNQMGKAIYKPPPMTNPCLCDPKSFEGRCKCALPSSKPKAMMVDNYSEIENTNELKPLAIKQNIPSEVSKQNISKEISKQIILKEVSKQNIPSEISKKNIPNEVSRQDILSDEASKQNTKDPEQSSALNTSLQKQRSIQTTLQPMQSSATDPLDVKLSISKPSQTIEDYISILPAQTSTWDISQLNESSITDPIDAPQILGISKSSQAIEEGVSPSLQKPQESPPVTPSPPKCHIESTEPKCFYKPSYSKLERVIVKDGYCADVRQRHVTVVKHRVPHKVIPNPRYLNVDPVFAYRNKAKHVLPGRSHCETKPEYIAITVDQTVPEQVHCPIRSVPFGQQQNCQGHLSPSSSPQRKGVKRKLQSHSKC